jgi:transposase
VGPVTALTWALEIAEPERFHSAKAAMSYCGLTSALRESAGQQKRGPLSKQRNRHLQSALIEAAKIAPMVNDKLRETYLKAKQKGGHANRATLAVARKLAAYLLAADRAFFASQPETPAA